MGHRLRSVTVDGGRQLYEKACENYVCRFCGRQMISCNFVNGVCIQVFVSHGDSCGLFDSNINAFRRTAEVTCDSCKYYVEGKGCTCEKENERINSVRTNA